MKRIAIILLILISFTSYGQNNRRKDTITRKENQQVFTIREKQEKSGTINLLYDDHSNQNFKRYEGKILVLNENAFRYDDKVLIISNTSNDLKKIFEIGILYPNIFVESNTVNPSEKENPDSTIMNNDTLVVNVKITREKVALWFNRTDSLMISDFKEIKNVNESPKIRVFEFLLFYKGFANPTEYNIELTNNNATRETSLETFINGARLTLVIKGSILI